MNNDIPIYMNNLINTIQLGDNLIRILNRISDIDVSISVVDISNTINNISINIVNNMNQYNPISDLDNTNGLLYIITYMIGIIKTDLMFSSELAYLFRIKLEIEAECIKWSNVNMY